MKIKYDTKVPGTMKVQGRFPSSSFSHSKFWETRQVYMMQLGMKQWQKVT